MTLSTHIIILDPTPPRPIFDLGVSLLALHPKVTWEPITKKMPSPYHGWGTVLGQGLPAIFDVHYASDGPLTYYDDSDAEWLEGPIPEWNEHAVRVWFDTTYSYYHGPNGGGCGDLHVWLAGRIAEQLDDLGVRYLWWLDFYDHEDAQTTPIAPPEWGDPELGRLG